MIVCHCRLVRDDVVRNSIAAGASDVESVAQLCGAGSECGGCHDSIDALLHEHSVAVARRRPTAA